LFSFIAAQDEEEVGKLKIIKYPGQKSTVSLSLSEKTMLIDADEKIPKDHRFDVQAVKQQTLGVFSHNCEFIKRGLVHDL
jgi:TFIIF, beta subunit N-terminus